jgi:hypothetical protein
MKMKKIRLFALLFVLSALSAMAQLMNNQVTVAHSGTKVRWSQVALGPDGVAHVCYVAMWNVDWPDPTDTNPLYYVSYNGTTASTPVMLTAHYEDFARQPGIGAGANGMVAVVWAEPHDHSIFMRVLDPATHAWQTIERVSNWGQDEPSVVIEPNGNIHVYFWDSGTGRCISKSKINGVWEGEMVLSNQDTRCMKGGISLALDGTIWAVWMERECASGGGSCEYKVKYSTRTASTYWVPAKTVNPAGLSQELPMISVGPDGIPWVTWGDTTDGEMSAVAVARLDGVANPLTILTGHYTQHGPRTATDIYNNCHISIQQGGGDYGNGILYLNNVGGTWKTQIMEGAYTKTGGISADSYGNVAVSWSAYFGGEGSDVFINSLQPIVPKYFYPPVNPLVSLSSSGVRRSPRAVYRLSWSANPVNNDQYLSGYKIYLKENNGNYTLVSSVGKATFNATFTFTDLSKKRRFAITTVNMGGAESARLEFN